MPVKGLKLWLHFYGKTCFGGECLCPCWLWLDDNRQDSLHLQNINKFSQKSAASLWQQLWAVHELFLPAHDVKKAEGLTFPFPFLGEVILHQPTLQKTWILQVAGRILLDKTLHAWNQKARLCFMVGCIRKIFYHVSVCWVISIKLDKNFW